MLLLKRTYMTDYLTAEDYLNCVQNWTDPNPEPIIEVHNGIHVVRDDLLNFGSKIRGVDFLIRSSENIKEWVFGSCPATGYAQISLPHVCNKYGKKAVLFMAKRGMDNLHPYQKRGMELGAIYHWVENGMLTVTQKRARDYVAENSAERAVLPLGLEHPSVIGSFIKVARNLKIKPDYVWTVGSSGTLNRSLQLAWPEAEIHVVSVGHSMSEREKGRAILHMSEYKFDKPVKENEMPPFNSARTYDAKGWLPMLKWKEETNPKGTVLFWNVGGD